MSQMQQGSLPRRESVGCWQRMAPQLLDLHGLQQGNNIGYRNKFVSLLGRAVSFHQLTALLLLSALRQHDIDRTRREDLLQGLLRAQLRS
jgi:hypothetical protein